MKEAGFYFDLKPLCHSRMVCSLYLVWAINQSRSDLGRLAPLLLFPPISLPVFSQLKGRRETSEVSAKAGKQQTANIVLGTSLTNYTAISALAVFRWVFLFLLSLVVKD